MHVSGYGYNTHYAGKTSAIQTPQAREVGISAQQALSAAKINAPVRPANNSAPSVSEQVKTTLLKLQEADTSGNRNAKADLETSNGRASIDIDEYFAPQKNTGDLLNNLPPLILPTADNIEALSQHASDRFKQLLEKYDIPLPPQQITYDHEGKMQLPDDYPYASELKQALKDDPGLDRELRTLHALTSHFVGTREALSFQREYANASSQAEIDRVISKYGHLFNDNRAPAQIALKFSSGSNLSISVNGKTM